MLVFMSIFFFIIAATFIAVIILSPGNVEQFKDSNGKVLENSIAEKTFINVNGAKQGMIIKGKNKDNPVLLFVHGGPGMPEYFLTKDYPTHLEDYFTVVWLDQRGTCLSFDSNIDDSTMNIEQSVDDTIAVTNYLRQRFSKDKIYLMAHSWGSLIGMKTVKKAPELFKAYIGIGQITYTPESEKRAYEYMIDYYSNTGDLKTAEKLKNMNYESNEYTAIRDEIMHKAGIGTMHNMDSVVKGIFFRSLLNNEYTLSEKVNLWRGEIYSSKTQFSHDRDEIDLRNSITKVDLPIYFFSGLYDYTVNYEMAEEYLKSIDAPIKGFYLFDNSAHSPIFEEQDKVNEIMRDDVLQGTNTSADIK